MNRGAAGPALSAEELERHFSYHPPVTGQPEKYRELRQLAKEFAEGVARLCPPSADRSTAYRCIREAVMWANASIATAPEDPPS